MSPDDATPPADPEDDDRDDGFGPDRRINMSEEELLGCLGIDPDEPPPPGGYLDAPEAPSEEP